MPKPTKTTGPTGVEFSGEFVDFLNRDLAKFYPRLVDLVSFKIVQAGATVRVFQGWVCMCEGGCVAHAGGIRKEFYTCVAKRGGSLSRSRARTINDPCPSHADPAGLRQAAAGGGAGDAAGGGHRGAAEPGAFRGSCVDEFGWLDQRNGRTG